MTNSPKPNENTAATGESEADAAHQVKFETNKSAGPGKGIAKSGVGDEPADAGEHAEAKRKRGSDGAAPGAIEPEELTTENDDGAG